MKEFTCFLILTEWEKPTFSFSWWFKFLFQTFSLPSIIGLLRSIRLFFDLFRLFCFCFRFSLFGLLNLSFNFLLGLFLDFLGFFLFLFDGLRLFFNFRGLNKRKVYSDLFDDISNGFSFSFIFNDISKVFDDTIISEFIGKISGGNHFNKSESWKGYSLC